MQSKANALFLKNGDLRWSVVDPLDEVRAYDHPERAGLQLADAVASAFYQAVSGEPTPDPEFALALKPRLTRNEKGSIFGYGIKLMPPRYLERAPEQHRKFFDSFV